MHDIPHAITGPVKAYQDYTGPQKKVRQTQSQNPGHTPLPFHIDYDLHKEKAKKILAMKGLAS